MEKLTNANALLGGFIQVDPIRPERVQTIEFGYRSTLFDKLYLDASIYLVFTTDFIGYQTGASFAFGGEKVAEEEDVIAGWASNWRYNCRIQQSIN